ncbi:hypothetical protein IWQ60_002121 [Tieghemiomyces parasiticus]|uniref:Uncharacterized protein n=1 Tax=Tieghemiomyces parasiticus TaxID=78921 RepID=A0A9W8DXN4_9FUNG|nr:hypothetical protein IWQ60_002121 [Tieghemiomyces parasiticus]
MTSLTTGPPPAAGGPQDDYVPLLPKFGSTGQPVMSTTTNTPSTGPPTHLGPRDKTAEHPLHGLQRDLMAWSTATLGPPDHSTDRTTTGKLNPPRWTPPTLYQIHRAQITVNYRQLRAHPLGRTLQPGRAWSPARQLWERCWQHLLMPFWQGFAWGLAQNWLAYARALRPWTWFRQRFPKKN